MPGVCWCAHAWIVGMCRRPALNPLRMPSIRHVAINNRQPARSPCAPTKIQCMRRRKVDEPDPSLACACGSVGDESEVIAAFPCAQPLAYRRMARPQKYAVAPESKSPFRLAREPRLSQRCGWPRAAAKIRLLCAGINRRHRFFFQPDSGGPSGNRHRKGGPAWPNTIW